jgi:hypothetical protein
LSLLHELLDQLVRVELYLFLDVILDHSVQSARLFYDRRAFLLRKLLAYKTLLLAVSFSAWVTFLNVHDL